MEENADCFTESWFGFIEPFFPNDPTDRFGDRGHWVVPWFQAQTFTSIDESLSDRATPRDDF